MALAHLELMRLAERYKNNECNTQHTYNLAALSLAPKFSRRSYFKCLPNKRHNIPTVISALACQDLHEEDAYRAFRVMASSHEDEMLMRFLYTWCQANPEMGFDWAYERAVQQSQEIGFSKQYLDVEKDDDPKKLLQAALYLVKEDTGLSNTRVEKDLFILTLALRAVLEPQLYELVSWRDLSAWDMFHDKF